MISVRGLTKRFGPTVAVRNVSFDVEKGEVLGFLGPNGAGKTTTMRIITCYMPADEGTASVEGYDVFEDSVEVRKRIGYLPENAPLYMDMGVTEYLSFIAQMRGIPRERTTSRIRDMIEICGLGPVIQKGIGELSRGFRQRVGLAQTLIHDPEVLILDEPTSGLDPKQIIGIRNLIREIGKEKTIILSTHILPEVEATCSRVIIINEGELVASGTAKELASQAMGETRVSVSIRGPAADVENRLRELAGVAEVSRVGELGEGAEAYNQYQLVVTNGGDVGGDIFSLVAEQGWALNELHREETSLEDAFLRITLGEK